MWFISYILPPPPKKIQQGLEQNPILKYAILMFLQQIVWIHTKCEK